MNKLLLILKWILIVVISILFITSGYPKIIASASMIKRFAAWGFSEWFVYCIGILELIGGILLLIPKASLYAALLLICIMTGAIFTHLTTGIGSPGFALVTLILLFSIVYLRFMELKRKGN